jgi:hypothetical protein
MTNVPLFRNEFGGNREHVPSAFVTLTMRSRLGGVKAAV